MFERFSRPARVAVLLAQEEANQLDANEVRPEHLLVGVLQSAGRELSAGLAGYGLTAEVVREQLGASGAKPNESFDADADALRAVGIDLAAVRESIDRTFGENAFDNALHNSGRRPRRRARIPFTKPAKKALELALREALARKDAVIDSEHLLLGILRGGDRASLGAINEHVETAVLRSAVIAMLDQAA